MSANVAVTAPPMATAMFPKLAATSVPPPSQMFAVTSSPPLSTVGVVTSPPVPMTSTSTGGGSSSSGSGGKDSRWLTLEVCREHVRRRCSRSDDECRFAHPPAHVEVQNGRVVCCFDSIKGRCQRTDPPCKYLHPPQHLKEQLLQNGRNNLIMKNLQLQRLQPLPPTAAVYSFVSPYLVSSPPAACYSPYFGAASPSGVVAASTSSAGGSTVSASNGYVCAVNGAVNGNHLLQAPHTPTNNITPSSSTHIEGDCGGCCDDANPSSVNDQYWTASAASISAAGPTAIYAAVDSNSNPVVPSYFSPMFFPNVGAAPSGGVMLKPHQAVVGDVKNGYAIYSCGSTAYHQLAMPFQQAPCYPMAIAAPPPPVIAGSYQRY